MLLHFKMLQRLKVLEEIPIQKGNEKHLRPLYFLTYAMIFQNIRRKSDYKRDMKNIQGMWGFYPVKFSVIIIIIIQKVVNFCMKSSNSEDNQL